ncbi:cytochrome c3 family protein [Telmatobacter bradus]|uniref:cytochrome c3 family protein n=1 Tax=Telmatobacter bradus TaxID=474953 RepID=UPI003B4387C5
MKTRFYLLIAAASVLLFSAIVFAQDAAPTMMVNGKPTTAKKHIDSGLECSACHGEGKKTAVESDKCLECHESFKAVSERTTDMKPNPHANHLVNDDGVECTQCHHGHKANTVVCLRCHTNFNFDRHK